MTMSFLFFVALTALAFVLLIVVMMVVIKRQ